MLNCGVKVTVVTLDATHSSWFGYEEVNELRRIGTSEAEFAAQMLYHRIYAANLIGARAEEEERAPRRAGRMRGHRPVGSHRCAP